MVENFDENLRGFFLNYSKGLGWRGEQQTPNVCKGNELTGGLADLKKVLAKMSN
jgi:hypothetical protein